MTRKKVLYALAVVACVVAVLSTAPMEVRAETYSCTSGTVNISFDTATGVMYIVPTNGNAGTFEDDPLSSGSSPSDSYKLFLEQVRPARVVAIRSSGVIRGSKHMPSMFAHFTSLVEVDDLTSWDMSGVTDVRGMFQGCSRLKNVTPLRSWDISNVTTMSQMFSGCTALANASALSNWDVSNVTDMTELFSYDGKLNNVNMSGWNTKNVITANGMFEECLALSTPGTGSVTLGDRLSPIVIGSLPDVEAAKWFEKSAPTTGYTPSQLANKWNGATMSGVWELKPVTDPHYTLKFDPNGGKGSMSPVSMYTASGQTNDIPECKFYRNGYRFVGWCTVPDPDAKAEVSKTYGGWWNQWRTNYYSYSLPGASSMNVTLNYSVTATYISCYANANQSGSPIFSVYSWNLAGTKEGTKTFVIQGSNFSLKTSGSPGTAGNGTCSFTVTLSGYANVPSHTFQPETNSRQLIYNESSDRYAKADDVITLYALWEPIPPGTFSNGTCDITVPANQQVTISGLPAGASYEVTEIDVPSGWTLVKQRGTTGIIMPGL